ncbi:MAG TPA: tetratricopeptide repeat protein, partial [Chthonomonadaceae bacterium]|nr:tetratricopeptide repeat protein [Chthonomonadaceae bacterium]
ERFELLASKKRDKGERHRSLWAAIEWSYHLLPPALQPFFAHLSVFRGGWTLEAAEAVCEEASALDYLSQLRAHSLIIAEESREVLRFRMLETIQEFAAEILTPEDQEALKDRHRDHFLGLAEQTETAFFSAEQAGWLDRIEQEHDNMRAALRRCLEGEGRDAVKGLQLVASLSLFWSVRGHLSEGWAWCERVLAQHGAQEPTRWRAKALWRAASLASEQGDYDAAQAFDAESLAIYRAIGDRRSTAGPRGDLGKIAVRRGDLAEAQALYTQNLQIYRELGDRAEIAASLTNLGWVLMHRGEEGPAQSFLSEALTLHREAGNRVREALCLNHLGSLAEHQGRLEEARSLHEQSLAIRRNLEDKNGIAASLCNLGNVVKLLQEEAMACSYYEESLSLVRQLGDRHQLAITLVNLGGTLGDHGDPAAGRDYLVECLQLCRQLNAQRVAAYALEAFARIAQMRAEAERAARLWAAAHALREAISCPHPPPDRERLDRYLAALREDLGEEAFTAAWEEGMVLTLDQAAVLALTIAPSTA